MLLQLCLGQYKMDESIHVISTALFDVYNLVSWLLGRKN